MSDPVNVPPGDIGPFQINFFEACLPPLQAGNYTLVANQQAQNLKDEPTPPQFDATQSFRVDGPRYSLNPNDISMVFPPANQQGKYTDTLPNITFTQRALPWARSIGKLKGGGTDIALTPWIALLTFYPGELTSAPVQMTVSEIITPTDTTVLGPALEDVPADELKQNALALDVDFKLFQGIAPQYVELQYLAHARQVNTDGKVIMGLNEDGFFSVLVGNRVAYTPPNDEANTATNNTVYLVSLEGHQNHLPPTPTVPSNIKTIRLICLASWKFKAEATPGDFLDLMRQLPKLGGVKLLQLPYTMPTGTLSPEQQLVKEALDTGYVPLQNNMRDGEQATAWYHGPFVPAVTARNTTYGPYHYSDHAMHYDPDTGIFNLSYAVAWQIGRLLALSDKSFAMALFKWRQSHKAQVVKLETRVTQQQFLSSTLDFPADPSSVVGEAAFRNLLTNFLSAKVGPMLASEERVVPRVQPRTLRLDPAAFPGVLSQAELDDVLMEDAEPMLALRKKIFGS